MSFSAEYPQQRYLLPRATVRRELLLPGGTYGMLLVSEGQRVEVNTVIARGQLPSYHHLVDAADILKLRNPADLEAIVSVSVEEFVEAGQALTSRGRRVRSPVDGIVASITDGRIIIREQPGEVELIAGMPGFVVEVRPRRGAVIQTAGAVMQGVWGNNQRAVGAIRMEPDEGLELIQGDDINLRWRGAIVVTRQPLSELGLQVMEEQDIAGVVAPSMDSTLLNAAMSFSRAILLTEGFGEARMGVAVQNFLTEIIENNPNIRGSLDAVQPSVMEARRPELLMNIRLRDSEEPRPPRTADRLRPGMSVRVTSPPYVGQSGVIEAVPAQPEQIDGGLRVPVVHLRLTAGEIVTIPIANVELFAG